MNIDIEHYILYMIVFIVGMFFGMAIGEKTSCDKKPIRLQVEYIDNLNEGNP